MKGLSDLLQETLLKEKNITVDADVIFDGGKKEQQETERKYGIKFKFRSGHFCDISGPIEKVKKYILDKDGYGLDKDDAEDIFPELFESKQITEAAKFKNDPYEDYWSAHKEFSSKIMKLAKDLQKESKTEGNLQVLKLISNKAKLIGDVADTLISYNDGRLGDDQKAFNQVIQEINKI